MDLTLYADKLSWYKQNEKPEVVLVIADNQELIKIIIAWTNLKVTPAERLTELTGESENEVWNWLWENAKFSLTEFKAMAGVPYSEMVLEQRIKPLIGYRILYPDGTINSFVQRFLRGEVAKLFETQHKATRKNVKN